MEPKKSICKLELYIVIPDDKINEFKAHINGTKTLIANCNAYTSYSEAAKDAGWNWVQIQKTK